MQPNNKIVETYIGEYLYTTDKNKISLNQVHQYLSTNTYWALQIPFDVVKNAFDNSYCFGIIFNKATIGFARMVTDFATFSYLADVYIQEAHRGKGLGKKLIAFIHSNPNLQGQRRWMLATRDAQSLYQQFDWTFLDDEQQQRVMQIRWKNGYG
jgi:GNAT superfamily N-acetyltransferase